MKVVINRCYGGFGLSAEANDRLVRETKGEFNEYKVPRDNPTLISIVKEMGEAADGPFAELEVVEIPDGVDWYVEEYDGKEWIGEGRTWP